MGSLAWPSWRYVAAAALAGSIACASIIPPVGGGAAGSHEGWGPAQFDAERRCQAGRLAACSELGRFLIVNTVSRSDVKRGFTILESACRRGDLAACSALGERYAWETDAHSRARARELLTGACDRGWGEACVAYGKVVQGGNFSHHEEAARWFLRGCDLGDSDGCERYGEAGATLRQRKVAMDGFARACKMGRRMSCHHFGGLLLSNPTMRAAAVDVFAENCGNGFGASCTAGAVLLAPLLGPLADCKRAAPMAEKTCRSREAWACAVSDACKLDVAADRADAIDRLRIACGRKEPLACLYWAAAPPPSPTTAEEVRAAYETACLKNSPASAVACPRLAGLQQSEATTEAEARRPVSFLKTLCEQSIGEACCELAAVYKAGKWVALDPPRADALRAKACDLGSSRCCGPTRPYFKTDAATACGGSLG